MIEDSGRKGCRRACLLWACLPIVIGVVIVASQGAVAKPAAGKNATQPSTKTPRSAANKFASNGKAQLIVLAKPGTSKESVKASADQVNGTVVSSTTDGTSTFYLIEVDPDKSTDAIKTLTKDNNFRSVNLSHHK